MNANSRIYGVILIAKNPRDPDYDSFRYDNLLEKVIKPAMANKAIACKVINPNDLTSENPVIFKLIESADILVLDTGARSATLLYCLGVRHALTNKPTITFYERDYVEEDVIFPMWIRYFESWVYDYHHFEFKTTKGILELRKRLEEALDKILEDHTQNLFSPVRSALDDIPRVFLSYSHEDVESVRAVDQWLRDKGARVDIDERTFIAGEDIRDEILKWVRMAGKVVCFYSHSSSERYYPKLERRLAEEMEMVVQYSGQRRSVLIYFRLDDTPLPLESSHRLAINAWTMGFESACDHLWRSIVERIADPKRIPLNKYRKRPPWKK